MKVELEKISSLERKLSFIVPVEKVNASFANAYAGLQKRVAMPGFRKGKTPMNIIKQKYKDQITPEVVEKIVNDAYFNALQEHKLDPVAMPQIQFDNIQENQNFAFTAQLEVRPEIKISKIAGLEIEKEILTVEDKDVDLMIKGLRDNRAKLVAISETRPAQKGDTATIDFEGFVDGSALENGAGNNYPLELGSNSFIEGFEEGIVGMNVGDKKELSLSFPNPYHDEKLAGKAVMFKVSLHKLETKELPELNDEFAKSAAGANTMAELREQLKSNLLKREEKRIKEELKTRAMRVIVESNPVEIPKSLLTEQKKMLVDDVHNRMQQQGYDHQAIHEYIDKWDEDFNKTAMFVIQSGYLISEIAKTESIKVEAADRDNKLASFAEESRIPLEQLRSFYTKGEQLSRLDFQILEEKVVDFVVAKAKLKELSKDKLSPIE